MQNLVDKADSMYIHACFYPLILPYYLNAYIHLLSIHLSVALLLFQLWAHLSKAII